MTGLICEWKKCSVTAWSMKQRHCSTAVWARTRPQSRLWAITRYSIIFGVNVHWRIPLSWSRRQMDLNWIELNGGNTTEVVAIVEDALWKSGFSPNRNVV